MILKSVHSRADYLIGSKFVLDIAARLLGPLEVLKASYGRVIGLILSFLFVV